MFFLLYVARDGQKERGTYGVFVVVAVDVWADDGEVLESLGRRRVRDIDDHSQVVPDRAHAALKRPG